MSMSIASIGVTILKRLEECPKICPVQRGLCTDDETSSYMITCIGLANMLGQIMVGAFADLPWVNSSVVTGCAMMISGLSVSLLPTCQTYVQVMVASALFGMSFAAVISLASIVLVDNFGLESLTASIGLLTLLKAGLFFQHLKFICMQY